MDMRYQMRSPLSKAIHALLMTVSVNYGTATGIKLQKSLGGIAEMTRCFV
ncbi:hypothetical protein [Sphingobium sp. RAC03]|nr:hypothetical protein [Sphingobium sp. RAC03]|tara:strand:- start:2609 stop:2758 length:150 start_codon:yes stop_codon:yes gene_type:complete